VWGEVSAIAGGALKGAAAMVKAATPQPVRYLLDK
jgi:hypothetical protein